MNDLLTKDELEAVTGAKQWSKMAEVLSACGIFYIPKANGEISTTWHHVHNPARITGSNEPDFDQVG